MNILITGAAGYIGSHTAISAANRGFNIVLLDNLSNSNFSTISNIRFITKKKIPFVKVDIRDTEKLKRVLLKYDINLVMHFAAKKIVTESFENPLNYFSNNIEGTISLLQAMQSLEIKFFIFSSSAAVYGQALYAPIDENHPISSLSPYSLSKIHIEQMLSEIAKSDRSWKIVCLRYFNPVGSHPTNMIGEDSNDGPNLMPQIVKVAIGQKNYLEIFGKDHNTFDGTGIRDYIHVLDIAEGHLAAIDKLDNINGINFINLGTGNGVSVLEIIKAFENISGKKIPYKFVSKRPGDISVSYANVTKALNFLNWKAIRNLEDMCQSVWSRQLNQNK
jgi:UDP-glucose 4-epimerase